MDEIVGKLMRNATLSGFVIFQHSTNILQIFEVEKNRIANTQD